MLPRNLTRNLMSKIKFLSEMEGILPAPDDTASSPHESNASIVEVPPELLGGLPEQHEALRV